MTRKRLEKLRRDRDASRVADLESARELAAKVEKLSCTIQVKIGEGDKMYGSVTNADIAEALNAQELGIDKHKVALPEPIKELGVYDVEIKIHPEIDVSVKIWVVEE